MEILNIENLCKKYKGRKVLKNLNLTIEEGEIVTLIGPNGSGKTTLMKAICHLIEHEEGEIRINGFSCKSDYVKYMSQFSCIIESPTFYEEFSGYENLRYIAKLNKVSKEKVDEIITFINIGQGIYRKVKEYSLGMKQRLALGMVVLQNPKLIILDEPTNGLDLDAIIEFKKLMIKLKQEKKISILIATHIISDIESLSDRNLFLKDSVLYDVALLKEKETVKYLTFTPKDEEWINSRLRLFKEIEKIERLPEGRVKVAVKKENLRVIIEELEQDDLFLEDIELTNKGLEEIFEEFYHHDASGEGK